MIRAILTALVIFHANGYAQQIERPPVDWKLIYGLEIKDGKIYIDSKSLISSKTLSHQINTGDLMVSFDAPTETEVNGKKLTYQSSVHTFVVDCDSGRTAPVFDVYFTEPMPTRSSKPLTGRKYPNDVRFTSFFLDKKSVVFNAFCPIYI